jgi:hypothetical protein
MAPVGKLLGPGHVVVSWHAPDAPALLGYQVARSRGARPGVERRIWGGLATTITDRPGKGTWWYRIYVTPGFHPDGLPPSRVFAESAPIRLVVGG